MIDFVDYIDTDSVFLNISKYLERKGLLEKFENLSQDKQLEFINKLSKPIEDYVNRRSFEEVQKNILNSREEDFKITFKQEKIVPSGLFATKKRYSLWVLTNEGEWKDEISTTGMEIIRSDSPELVKPKIKKVLEMLLKHYSDEEMREYIKDAKKELKKSSPYEIAENKGVNNLDKYIVNKYKYKKGAPHHVKGVANLRFLLEKLDLENEVEQPQEGVKAKIVYLKKNRYNIDCLSFLTWHEKFDKVIQVDYEKMIANNFTKKLESILKVAGKEHLLEDKLDVESLFD